ncbi:MAG: iron-sulfur cluster assembly scaffold protein [Holosporales bacterium]|jgi:nitrogen fixation NifU-like protein|nr:iron-sulfur cluster assembly scaffold protein [Holosporales bacterium]
MKYSEKTLNYYNSLKRVGGFDENNKSVGTGIVGSPLCGDVMKIQILFDKDDKIIEAKHKVFGCVSAIASMELACKKLNGLTIEQAQKIENLEVAEELELSDIKKHCSVLAKEAITAAVEDYLLKKNNIGKKMITVSEYAIKKLKELITSKGKECKGVSVVINNAGCAGINYTLAYEIEEKNIVDKKFENIDGVFFFYNEDDEILINGIEINVVENSLGVGFVVTNKNQFSCENCTCKCA